MRLAVLLALVAACSTEAPLEVLQTGNMQPGATELEMGEVPLYRAANYWPVRVRNTMDRPMRVDARLEEPVPAGVRVQLTGDTTLLPKGTGELLLSLTPPASVGAFEGRISLVSEDLSDWSYTYRYSGVVVRKPLQGRYIEVEPMSHDFGQLSAGEARDFEFIVRNVGSEPFRVREWSPVGGRLQLERFREVLPVEPGEELRLRGTLTAPTDPGPFREKIRIFSDAQNRPLVDVAVRGTIATDHEVIPHRLDWGNVYRAEQPECTVRIRAREGVQPFTVGSVDGVRAHFDVLSSGSPEPAAEQTVRLKLKRNAPVGPLQYYELRFHLEPGGEVLVWPVGMMILPSIHAQPARADFGKVRQGREPTVEIRLASYAGKGFGIQSAQSDNARFVVEKHRAAPLPWTIRVRLAPGVGVGLHTGQVSIETDDPDTPRLLIPVRAQVVPQ